MEENKKVKQFLAISPSDNIDFAAQQIINHFTDDGIECLMECFVTLDKALYKSWAKEMTFDELKQALAIISELKK